jgi:CDGSH-type Zn-finger protein
MSESEVIVKALTDGPLEVAGAVEILAADGSLIKQTEKAYLCRCGFSEKKPFCDGAHKREGFTAP